VLRLHQELICHPERSEGPHDRQDKSKTPQKKTRKRVAIFAAINLKHHEQKKISRHFPAKEFP